MKKIFALVLALVMVLSLAACGSSNNAAPAGDDSAPSVLVMGTSPDYPPYEFYADAALTQFAGIDVEVGSRIRLDDERFADDLLERTRQMRHYYQERYDAMCQRIETDEYWAPYRRLADYYRIEIT